MSTSMTETTAPRVRRAPNKGLTPEPRFDPAEHLAYQPPAEQLTMERLGLGHVPTPSPIGVTSPFPLASLSAVTALRNSVLQPEVLDGYMTASALAGPHCQLRGMAPHAAKFVYDFWTHPTTMRNLCEAAGEDLIPVFELELGHTNIQVPKGKSREDYVRTLHPDPFHNTPAMEPPADADPNLAAQGEEDMPMVVDFHRDAYPWVAVLMLSDVSSMIGGETAVRLGSGELFKARGPALGSCVMMQGGYISHAALPCRPHPSLKGTDAQAAVNERITMVTSFRKRSAFGWRDVSNLENIRSCSNWNELYAQWVTSRVSILEEKLGGFRRLLEARRRNVEAEFGLTGGLQRPVVSMQEFEALKRDVEDHLERALQEMLPYGHDSDRFTPIVPAKADGEQRAIEYSREKL